MCWLKDLVKIHLKLSFANNILLELEQINYLSLTLVMPRLFKTKVFKLIATGKVRGENLILSQIEPVQCWKKYEQNNPCYLQKFPAVIRYLAIIPTQQEVK